MLHTVRQREGARKHTRPDRMFVLHAISPRSRLTLRPGDAAADARRDVQKHHPHHVLRRQHPGTATRCVFAAQLAQELVQLPLARLQQLAGADNGKKLFAFLRNSAKI